MNYIKTDKIFKHGLVLPTNPVTVEMWLCGVGICTNNCYYCSMGKKNKGTIMNLTDIKYNLRFLKDLGTKGLILSGGGEPLLSPDFNAVLSTASVYGLDTGIITNGTELNSKNRQTILKNSKWVRISLDAIDEEQYTKIRGVNTFDKVINNIKLLVKDKIKYESKCTIGVQMVVNKYNYKTIKEFIAMCKTQLVGIDYIQVRPFETMLTEQSYSKPQENVIKKQLEEIKNKKVDVRRIGSDIDLIISNKWDITFSKNREYGFDKCHCVRVVGVITDESLFYLCCHVVGNPNYCFGNTKAFGIKGFLENREKCIRKLGTTLGLDPNVCPVACRGAGINRSIQGVIEHDDHDNFL